MDKKYCKKCDTDKDTNLFYRNKTKKDGLQSICKSCSNEISKQHYESNKEAYLKKAKKAKNKLNVKIVEYKSKLSCTTCGESRPWVLDFHHTNPKNKEIGVSQASFISYSLFLKEIKKCIVLCSNCHRDLHYKQNL